MDWVSRISSAVHENRLELYFQPIVRLRKQVSGNRRFYELLLRMRSETGEIIDPDIVIGASERSNVVSTLDRWVIHRALSEFVDTNSVGEARYTLAINVSGASLSEDRFRAFVIDELAGRNLPNGAICIEVTETAAISNYSVVGQFLQELKDRGYLVTQDNFGAGMSSFGYLKRLPVDYLKIDAAFFKNILHDPTDREMVRSINEIAHMMGKQTIAQSVEDKETVTMLRGIGIDYAQGDYIAPPATMQTFEPFGDTPGLQHRPLQRLLCTLKRSLG